LVQATTEAVTEQAVEIADNSIAVLPFVNMSDDAANEYFSDGISEELVNLLAKIPELRVISRSSSFSFKGKDVKIAEVARAAKRGPCAGRFGAQVREHGSGHGPADRSTY